MDLTKNSSPRVRTIRFLFSVLAALFFGCIVLQVFFAGMAIFAGSGWGLHTTFVKYFESISLLMFLLSFFGRIRGSLRWLSLGFYLMITFQHMSIQVFRNIGLLAAFHTIIALLLFWGSMHIMKKSWKWLRFL